MADEWQIDLTPVRRGRDTTDDEAVRLPTTAPDALQVLKEINAALGALAATMGSLDRRLRLIEITLGLGAPVEPPSQGVEDPTIEQMRETRAARRAFFRSAAARRVAAVGAALEAELPHAAPTAPADQPAGGGAAGV